MPKKRDVPQKPACFGESSIMRPMLEICQRCPYYYPCWAKCEHPDTFDSSMYKTMRKGMEESMAKSGLPLPDAVLAIRYFLRSDPPSENAIKLSFSRRLKKYGHT